MGSMLSQLLSLRRIALLGPLLPLALVSFCSAWAVQKPEVRADVQTVSQESPVAEIVRYVIPSQEELQWLELGWLPSLREGLLQGTAQEKPVLLWAMNGHPLAST